MKVCYCDESGTGDEPIAVMVGVIVDSHRMHVTKADWQELLNRLSSIVRKKVSEIHTRDLYAGNDYWRGLTGAQRSEIISGIFSWLAERRHDIVYVSVHKETFAQSRDAGRFQPEISTVWRFMGLHLLLSIQKQHQRLEKNKGHTIFIFDNEERERMNFTDMVSNPPVWTDTYYTKKRKQERLDQIIDVPYFGDSTQVHLLQLADFLAFFLRRHAEIEGGHSQERYIDEATKIGDWIEAFKSRAITGSSIYPATGRCECSELFFAHASPVIRDLHRS